MADDMERRVGNLEVKTVAIETKVDAFIQEMRDFKTEMRENMADFKAEMRQQNEMRAREIAELRQETNQKVDQLSRDIKDIGREVRTIFIGFAAIVVALVITLFNK